MPQPSLAESLGSKTVHAPGRKLMDAEEEMQHEQQLEKMLLACFTCLRESMCKLCDGENWLVSGD